MTTTHDSTPHQPSQDSTAPGRPQDSNSNFETTLLPADSRELPSQARPGDPDTLPHYNTNFRTNSRTSQETSADQTNEFSLYNATTPDDNQIAETIPSTDVHTQDTTPGGPHAASILSGPMGDVIPPSPLPQIERPETIETVHPDLTAIPALPWTFVELRPHVPIETNIKRSVRQLLGCHKVHIRRIRRRHRIRTTKSQHTGSDKYSYHAIVATEHIPLISKLLERGQIALHRPPAPGFRSRRERPDSNPDLRPYFVSWNINGIMGKRPIIRAFCLEERVGVLALQETIRYEVSYGVYIPGYKSFEVAAEIGGCGSRGMATLVHNSLGAERVGPIHPNLLAVRIPNCNGAKVIAINAYVPSGTGKARVKREIAQTINALRFENPDYTLALMGDLNSLPDTATRWLTTLHLTDNKWSGSKLTRRPYKHRLDGRYTALDHIALSGPQGATLLGPTRVRRCWLDSDHFPIRARLRPHPPPQPPPVARPLRVRTTTAQQRDKVVQHIQWSVLADLDLPVTGTTPLHDDDPPDPDRAPDVRVTPQSSDPPPLRTLSDFCEPYQDLERVAKDFVLKSKTIATEVFRPPGPPRNNTLVKSTAVTRALLRRKHKAMKIFNALSAAEQGEQKETLLAISKACDKALRSAGRQAWLGWLRTQLLAADAGDLKAQWRLIDRVLHRGHPPQTSTPMFSSWGVMVVSPTDLAKVWTDHYQPLFADATGHSRDPNYWSSPPSDAPAQHLDVINGPISIEEVRTALRQAKNGKAPGVDGLTYEFLKIALDDNHPAMLQVIHRILETMWTNGQIPEVWQSATMVNIAKKGNLTDPGNYRGISLICNMVKLLCLIVNRRMYTAVELHGILAKEQAGFRQREECVAQAFVLRETTLRRICAAEPTYLAFIDFQKAYDMVPHEGLFHKLAQVGFRGPILRFLRGLYRSSTVRVRVDENTLTDPIPVQRGLRQGCPLSPLLFNLFINDLPGAVNASAPLCYIPGVDTEISCLLFADDVVLIAEDAESLQQKLSAVHNWAQHNEMKIGIKKCGILAAGQRSPPLTIPMHLGSEVVPIVDHYTYLGLHFDQNVDILNIAKARLKVARATWAKLRPLARDTSVPLITRQLLIRNVALPVLLYGAELFPHAMTKLQPLQAEVNHWMRDTLRLSRHSGNPHAMAWELDLPLLSMAARAYQHRALLKFSTLKTFAADLLERPYVGYSDPTTGRTGHISFTDSTSSTLQRNAQHLHKRYADVEPENNRPFKARVLTRARLEEMSTQASTADTLKFYARIRRQRPRKGKQYYLRAALSRPSDASAIHHLTRARLGTYYTGAHYQFLDLDQRHRTNCHLCDAPGCETLVHMVFECEAREATRQSTGLRAALATFPPRPPSITEGEWQNMTLNNLLGSQTDSASHDKKKVHTHFTRMIIFSRYLQRCHWRCRPPERGEAGNFRLQQPIGTRPE